MELFKAAKKTRLTQSDMVLRYTDQPAHLPEEIRKMIRDKCGVEAIQLYAFVDLNSQFQLSESWLCLGEEHLFYARKVMGSGWDLD